MKKTFLALKQILSMTITILLVIIFPIVAFTLVTSKTPVLGFQSFIVVSGSMDPALPTGSIIYTQKSPDYKVGDVISFKDGKRTVTHRISGTKIENGNFAYITKGDANKTVDSSTVLKSNVVGKEILHAYHVGSLIYFLKTIPGFLLLIILPSLLFMGAELWNIKREFEKEIEKKIRKKISWEYSVKSINEYSRV